jgi:hypothetical protein
MRMRRWGLLPNLLWLLAPATALASEGARIECHDGAGVLVGADAGYISLDGEVFLVLEDHGAFARPDAGRRSWLTPDEACEHLEMGVGYVLPAPHPGEEPKPTPGAVTPPSRPMRAERGVRPLGLRDGGFSRPLPAPAHEPAPIPADVTIDVDVVESERVIGAVAPSAGAVAAAGCEAMPASRPSAAALLFAAAAALGLLRRKGGAR